MDENITTDLTVFVTLNNVKVTPKKKEDVLKEQHTPQNAGYI